MSDEPAAGFDDLGEDRVFSVAQAGRAGLDAAALRTAVRRGVIRRLQRGWYTAATPSGAVDEHLLRTIAAVRARPGVVAASHHSALVAYGLPLVDVGLREVCVDHLSDRRYRTAGGVRDFPCVAPPVVIERAALGQGLLVVPAAVAVAQVGCLHGPRAALAAADASLRLALATADDLAQAVVSLRRRAGIGRAAWALSIADGRRESPGESAVALVMHRAGIPVVPQLEVRDGATVWRADFAVVGHRVLIEFDGAMKYGSRDDLMREKRREDRLRELGWTVVRVVWSDLAHPDEIAHRVRRAMARSLGLAG